ncbi:putative beta-galactosidase 2 [Porphyridium purpureum]|uniref:Beta-galactosidase n=1 Tax=Porphyridium purpureum TaxID=35688 RepID=A0A5J4YZN6_PORPP|nr:putative beta-galactosidase 2 [Porphyridium purpureum]|eukprot:POR4587..scf208_2
MATVVTYSRRSISVGGTPVLLVSGSVHYPRTHPSEWHGIFARMRKNGLNCVDTYVFWNEHEVLNDNGSITYDFSGYKDLFGFCKSAQKHGLFVILRIGPYVCAEANFGGFPSRLRDVPGIMFRTYNEPFMRAVDMWLDCLAERMQVHSMTADQGGPVILVQLENEYSMVSEGYGADGARYLEWVAGLKLKFDLHVPMIMCFGSTGSALETINAFYGHEQFERHQREHPEQPAVWTEAWTGWYDVWGSPHHVRSSQDLVYASARFFAEGGSAVNYYMYYGGTNRTRNSTMYLQATSYDYDEPLDEFGNDTEKSLHLAAMHKVLLDHVEYLQLDRGNARPDVSRPNDSLSCFEWQHPNTLGWSLVFLCNDSHELCTTLVLDTQVLVRPRSVQIARKSGDKPIEVLFDTSVLSPEARSLSVQLEAVPNFGKEWMVAEEAFPMSWRSRSDTSISERSPPAPHWGLEDADLISLTQNSSDYAWYTTPLKFDSRMVTEKTRLSFRCEGADLLRIFLNGCYLGSSQEPLFEDRMNNAWTRHSVEPGFSHNIDCSLPLNELLGDGLGTTDFQLQVLCCSLGMVKGDWQLGKNSNMVHERKGIYPFPNFMVLVSEDKDHFQTIEIPADDWMVTPLLMDSGASADSERRAAMKQYLAIDSSRKAMHAVRPRWFYTELNLSAEERPDEDYVLAMFGMAKGFIRVNGIDIGRYWLVAGVNPPVGFLEGSPIQHVSHGSPTQSLYRIPRFLMTSGQHSMVQVEIFDELGAIPFEIQLLKRSLV